ncbi:hypothetical protein B0H14DRAFT_3467497 [Mycena olivaceomarginata]|nr:hypothetical protein B0H14DRAFT_3467497 [Mycena olivaceomarginata]
MVRLLPPLPYSIPAHARSLPAAHARSLPAVHARSLPAAHARSLPAAHARSLPTALALFAPRPRARYPPAAPPPVPTIPARYVLDVAGRPVLNPRRPSPAWALDTRSMCLDGRRACPRFPPLPCSIPAPCARLLPAVPRLTSVMRARPSLLHTRCLFEWKMASGKTGRTPVRIGYNSASSITTRFLSRKSVFLGIDSQSVIRALRISNTNLDNTC